MFGACQFGLGAITGAIVGHLHADTAVPMAATIAVCGVVSLALNFYVRRTVAQPRGT